MLLPLLPGCALAWGANHSQLRARAERLVAGDFTPPPWPSTPAVDECVHRASSPVSTDHLVVAMITSRKRHSVVAAHASTWMRGIRTLIVSDAAPTEPELQNSSTLTVAVLPEQRGCRGSDHYTTTIVIANHTYPGFAWMLFAEDDTFFSVDNVRHALGAFDHRVPLWFAAHGCMARYLPPTAAGAPLRPPPCLLGPLVGATMQVYRERYGRPMPTDAAGARSVEGLHGGPHAFLDVRAGRPASKTVNSSVGQSNCGGLGCIFSAGLIDSLAAAELTAPDCTQCHVGMADLQTSYCILFKSGVAPTGFPALTWGAVSHGILEGLVDGFPSCARSCGPSSASLGSLPAEPAVAGERRRGCLRRCAAVHGGLEWWSVHTRLYGKAWRNLPLEEIVAAQHDTVSELRALWKVPAVRLAHAARLCCFLVRRDLAQVQNGRVPWTRALPVRSVPIHMNPQPRLEVANRSRARSRGGAQLGGAAGACFA